MLKFSDALKKSAAKSTVRESDEEQPGRFVAYVDEGEASYDVVLELDADREPLSGSCDCDAKKPCRHMAALLLFVNEGKKVTTKVAPNKAKKKKQKPAEALLETVDNVALREWLGEVLGRNKELELAFTSRFRPANSAISPADVTRISDDAIKSILGRARHVDPSQLKRILKLWKDLHNPIVERYRSAPAEEAAFEPLNAVVEASIKLADYHRGGVQAVRYAEAMLHDLAPAVALLHQEEAFQRACGFFIAKMFSPIYSQWPAYLAFAIGIVEAVPEERLTWFGRQLALGFRNLDSSTRENYVWHAEQILLISIKAEIFTEFANVFPRILGHDRYNLTLLDALLKAGAFQRALDLGWPMFKSAYYNTPVELFLTLLVDAAVKLGDKDAEIKARQELFQRTFRREDFEQVLEAAQDSSVRKRLEKKFLALAVSSSRSQAGRFLAERYAASGDWKSFAQEVKRGKVPYTILQQHFEAMFKYSPELLLTALFDGESRYGGEDVELEQQALENLGRMIFDSYGEARIASVVIGTAEQPARTYYSNMLRQLLINAIRKSGRNGQ